MQRGHEHLRCVAALVLPGRVALGLVNLPGHVEMRIAMSRSLLGHGGAYGPRGSGLRLGILMGRASMGSSGAATAEREDVGKLLALIDLSTRMIEAQDEEEVLSLVSESISPLVSCRLVAAYRVHNAELIATMARPEPWQLIEHQLKGLNGLAGAVGLGDNRWAWAYPLRRFDDTLGYFVVDSDVVPSVFQRSLLELVAHQAALALRNVARCRQSRVRAGRCRSHSAAQRGVGHPSQHAALSAAANPRDHRARPGRRE